MRHTEHGEANGRTRRLRVRSECCPPGAWGQAAAEQAATTAAAATRGEIGNVNIIGAVNEIETGASVAHCSWRLRLHNVGLRQQ